MKTWKSNLEETKQRYINWWNHKGIILNMWEHFQEGVQPHAEITPPAPAKDLSQKWFDPQWRAEYLDWYVAHSSLKADILPVASIKLTRCKEREEKDKQLARPSGCLSEVEN